MVLISKIIDLEAKYYLGSSLQAVGIMCEKKTEYQCDIMTSYYGFSSEFLGYSLGSTKYCPSIQGMCFRGYINSSKRQGIILLIMMLTPPLSI